MSTARSAALQKQHSHAARSGLVRGRVTTSFIS
jgi:hypothetical protein